MARNFTIFNNKLVKSAKFLILPATSRLLYFYLLTECDDDGVVDAFPILRISGTEMGDLKILMDNHYVELLEEPTVVYLPHFLIHNSNLDIRRKKNSDYLEALARKFPEAKIAVKINNVKEIMEAGNYLEMETNLTTHGKNMASQVNVMARHEYNMANRVDDMAEKIDFQKPSAGAGFGNCQKTHGKNMASRVENVSKRSEANSIQIKKHDDFYCRSRSYDSRDVVESNGSNTIKASNVRVESQNLSQNGYGYDPEELVSAERLKELGMYGEYQLKFLLKCIRRFGIKNWQFNNYLAKAKQADNPAAYLTSAISKHYDPGEDPYFHQ